MKDYTNYDYQALVDRMTEILKDKEGWGDAYQSSTGQTLIQLMADVTDHLHYMLERRTLESFLDSAKLRTSVVARASELGYRPDRIKSHTGTLEVTILDNNGSVSTVAGEVNLAAMKKIVYDGRTFYVTAPSSIRQGESKATLRVKEGSLKIKTFDLAAGEEPVFPEYDNIEEDVFFVYNNGEEFFDVRKTDDVNKRALAFLRSDEAFYDIKYGVEGMRIVFGDGNFGKKPNGVIEVYYAQLDDLGDQILQTASEFEFASPLTDYQIPGIEYNYSLVNITPIVGGSQPESIDDIRMNAPAYHRSNGRAVTNEDYSYWATKSGISDIVDAKCYGEEEFDSLVYNANNVYLTYATSTGAFLTPEEKTLLQEYFAKIKTSQAHVIFNQARNVMLRLAIDVVKNKNVPISAAQAYSIVNSFVNEYLKIKKGSIGGFFHLSDLVNAMYGLKFNRHGVIYNLVDYVKISSDTVLPFDFPAKTNEAFVELLPSYAPANGDEFVIILDNLVCRSDVNAGENFRQILLNMRDVIREVTPFDALVQLSGVALDAFGNPIPVEIDPRVGYHLLIGVDTPYLSNTELVRPITVGSSIVGVALSAPELTIQHYYYSSRAGRRPMIPLRVGTTVTFTAPTDTAVRVYKRTVAKDVNTETLLTTVAAGGSFNQVFNDDHTLIFEYVANSDEDVIATIQYPSYLGVNYGLLIKAPDNFGTFSVQTNSGDLALFASVDYRIKLPKPDFFDATSDRSLLAGSLRLTDLQGNVIFRDNGNGRFVNNQGTLITSGRLDYVGGIVTLPKSLPPTTPAGKYLLMFDQNIYENLQVGSSDIIKYIQAPPSINSNEFSLSSLKVS